MINFGFFWDYIDEFLKIFALFIFFYILYGYIRILYVENRLNNIHEKIQEEIEQVNRIGGLMSVAEGRRKQIKDNYEFEIEKLERKRRYILDKIPFFK